MRDRPERENYPYAYDSVNCVIGVSATVGGNTSRNVHVYQNGRLVQGKHNTASNTTRDVTYRFTYDAPGRVDTVKVGAQTLSQCTYNDDTTLQKVTYGNGGEARCTYDAWAKKLATTGSLASTLGYLNPFRYRGYVYDEETGLYYLRSRYYNPIWGRFISSDVLFGRIGCIFSHNLFAYCCDNTVVYSDPNGNVRLYEIEVSCYANFPAAAIAAYSALLMGLNLGGGNGLVDEKCLVE